MGSLQVKGVEPPTEGCGSPVVFSAALEDSGEQEDKQLQRHEQQQHQQEPLDACSKDTAASASAGLSTHMEHRQNWGAFPLAFAKDRRSPEVQHKAQGLEAKLQLPKQVALRIALLYQFKHDDIGARIADLYLKAIERLRKSLRPKRKLVLLQVQEACLLVKSKGLFSSFCGPTSIDFRVVKDLFLGTQHSVEFREVNNKIKPLSQALRENRCCVLETSVRTYSLILDKPQDLAALCAVVDVYTARHGPAVWGTGGITHAVFASHLQARRLI
ncbi:hypothetical protein Esti_001478 [Eimeria stiedai]